ncbi:MAG: alpha/beta hydrolase [Pseudomonadota bacterium]
MNHITIGNHPATCVVYAHGWARSHADFIQVAESLESTTNSVLLDLPGFGESPRPESDWGSAEYADHCAAFIRQSSASRVIWVGHSFGGRIGLQLAVRHPQLLCGMVIVAGAGIPIPKTTTALFRRRLRQYRFKMARRRAKTGAEVDALENTYGSADYVHSKSIGMRDIFVKLVAEDQRNDAAKIKLPTRLIYGARDTETPMVIAEQLNALIPQSQLVRCPEFGHIDILSRGRHQIALSIKELIGGAAA